MGAADGMQEWFNCKLMEYEFTRDTHAQSSQCRTGVAKAEQLSMTKMRQPQHSKQNLHGDGGLAAFLQV